MESHEQADLAEGAIRPALLSPVTFRGLTLRNRIAISPMCMYSAKEGVIDDFHLVHLGRFAIGGAGLVFVEATAVSKRGRITQGCSGLWDDVQIRPLQRVSDFLHRFGCAAGIQLSHSGHKGSSQRPWEGGGPLGPGDLDLRGDEPWEPLGATAAPFDRGWPPVAEMSLQDIATTVDEFVAAAKRADRAGFDIVELHCAHGYLLHSFLSPLSNTRTDAYGGDIGGRMRFPLEVVRATRDAWPSDKPLFVRVSSVDGVNVGWSLDDSITFAKELKACGVDAVDCSSGGLKLEKHQNLPAREPGFQVPYAAKIRAEAGIPTVAVGLIRDPAFAEQLVADGKADLVSIAREALFHPNWPAEAALVLEGTAGWSRWPQQFGWWLLRRARQQKDR